MLKRFKNLILAFKFKKRFLKLNVVEIVCTIN